MSEKQWDKVDICFVDSEVVVKCADIDDWSTISRRFKDCKNAEDKKK